MDALTTRQRRLQQVLIALASLLIFILGVIFLLHRDQSSQVSLRVLGQAEGLAGQPWGVRVTAWDARARAFVPVLISSGRLLPLLGPGEGLAGRPAEGPPRLGAALAFGDLDLPPGEARLELELATKEGGARSLSVPMRILELGQRPDRWLRPALAHSLDLGGRTLSLRTPAGVILGDSVNRLLLRLEAGAPKETLQVSVDGGPAQALPLQQGFGALDLETSLPLHQLRFSLTPALDGAPELGLAPLGVTSLQARWPTAEAGPDSSVQVAVRTQTDTEALACGHWRDGRFLGFQELPLVQGAGLLDLNLRSPGIHRLACADNLTSPDPWTGEVFVLARPGQDDALARDLAALLKEPLLEPPPGGGEAWERWLLAMLEARSPGLDLLADTRAEDQQRQASGLKRSRTLMASAIAVVGLALLAFGLWVVLRQRRGLRALGQGLEGDLDELEAALGRRHALLPFVLVLLAALLNVLALLYLFLAILQ